MARRRREPDVRVGISGWTYPPWRGVFYPPKLPQRLELEHAASVLGTIEINGSFYALQRPESYADWYRRTPADFLFSVKGGRFVTHMKKLRDVETPLANFFASGVLALKDKLGPFLWQLPPSLGYDAGRMAAFFDQLPRTTAQAAELAKRHDERMEGRALTEADADRPLRHAVEVRHHTFETPAFLDQLREHRIAVVTADTAGRWPMLLEPTTDDLAYVRLHGAEELYASGYDDASLDAWAARVGEWRDAGRDVYVYFDNDIKVRAPYDAQQLAARLGVTPRR
jgi:uncharacterized protein YecE (DUF72 family)